MCDFSLTIAYFIVTSVRTQTLLNYKITSILYWWETEFHPNKCQLLRVTNKRKHVTNSYNIRGHKLDVVDSAKYIGVTIHKNFRWNEHIDNITKKANSTRAFIQRNLQLCPRNTNCVGPTNSP